MIPEGQLSVTAKTYVHEVLVNHLGGLSLPRKSVVRLSDCPDMTIVAYRGCKIASTLFANSTVSAFLGFSYIVGLH